MTAKAKLVNFWRPETSSIQLRFAIVDRTTTEGMTAQAQQQLRAALAAGQAAGLARIDVMAAKGGGHKSHFAGTEWDIVGYDASGKKWSDDQRVLVAEGTRRAGATRFGLYEGGGQTLHFGYGPPGYDDNVTWGAHGLTSGNASRQYASAANRNFMAVVYGGQPYLAYDEVAKKPVTVAMARVNELAEAGAKYTAKALPKGKYGEEAIVAAALTGNPAVLKKAFATLTSTVLTSSKNLDEVQQAQARITKYFGGLGKSNPLESLAVKAAFDKSPEMWSAVPALAAPMLHAGFDALPKNALALATGVDVEPQPRISGGPLTAGAEAISLGSVRERILEQGGLLRKGDYNSAASGEMQAFLNAAGVTDASGRALNVDQDFGPRTRQAVTAFQTSRGLKADGIVGPRTFGQMLRETTPPNGNPFAYMFEGGKGSGVAAPVESQGVKSASAAEGPSVLSDIATLDHMPVPAIYDSVRTGSALGGPPTNTQSIANATNAAAARIRQQKQQQAATASISGQGSGIFVPTLGASLAQAGAAGFAANSAFKDTNGNIKATGGTGFSVTKTQQTAAATQAKQVQANAAKTSGTKTSAPTSVSAEKTSGTKTTHDTSSYVSGPGHSF